MEELPERWARSWFPWRRYDMLTTNMVESMNSVLLKGREMPILRMLDFIQEKLGEWFYERRKKANETFHRVSILAEEEMTKNMDLAYKMFVFNLDSMLFRINSEGIEFIVDLNKRTCDYLEFQLDELPYPHATAAINKGYFQKSDYCLNWHSRKIWLKTYEGHVNTVGDQKSWDIPQNVQSEITKPPDVEILEGRRQKKRHIYLRLNQYHSSLPNAIDVNKLGITEQLACLLQHLIHISRNTLKNTPTFNNPWSEFQLSLLYDIIEM
ncbi:uncharacterized protein [Nicotiana sylvestris]|uniref:uncharacterized protein n=1 Tax=Nicotiana sylvestris TaxID=4096 RepID=UPI00388C7F4D